MPMGLLLSHQCIYALIWDTRKTRRIMENDSDYHASALFKRHGPTCRDWAESTPGGQLNTPRSTWKKGAKYAAIGKGDTVLRATKESAWYPWSRDAAVTILAARMPRDHGTGSGQGDEPVI